MDLDKHPRTNTKERMIQNLKDDFSIKEGSKSSTYEEFINWWYGEIITDALEIIFNIHDRFEPSRAWNKETRCSFPVVHNAIKIIREKIENLVD